MGCSAQPSRGQSLADGFDRAHSSVVTLRVTEIEMAPRSPDQVVTTRAVGAGVLISSDGTILTAAHVGHAADRIEVRFADGSRRWAEVVASESLADVALLRLTGRASTGPGVAVLGDSTTARVGDRVDVVVSGAARLVELEGSLAGGPD